MLASTSQRTKRSIAASPSSPGPGLPPATRSLRASLTLGYINSHTVRRQLLPRAQRAESSISVKRSQSTGATVAAAHGHTARAIPVTGLAASAHRQHGQASPPSTRCTAYTAAHNFLARPANASASTSANGDLVPSADQPHRNSSTAYRRQSSTPATVSKAQNHETLLPPPLNTYSQNNHTARSRSRPPKCSPFHRLAARQNGPKPSTLSSTASQHHR